MNTKNWADQQEEEENKNITIDQKGDIKIVTELINDDEGNRYKIVKKYSVEVRKVPKSVIKRKAWKKFGNAVEKKNFDKDHIKVCEETKIEFLNVNNKPEKITEETLVLKSTTFRCRKCQGPHFTHECDKDIIIDSSFMENQNTLPLSISSQNMDKDGKSNVYIPPHLKRGYISSYGTGGGLSSYDYNQRQKDECTIKVTNLPLICDEKDLNDLFSPIMNLAKTALIKDKITKASKGIAYITYKNKESAAKAVRVLNHHKYANMILNVEWARQSNN